MALAGVAAISPPTQSASKKDRRVERILFMAPLLAHRG
jgi:hypothetical protein